MRHNSSCAAVQQRKSRLPLAAACPFAVHIRVQTTAVVSCDAAPASEAKDSGSGKEEEEVCDRNRGGFRPDFTHQLFDEERIQGFKDGALTIQVLYTPTSLDFLVKIQTSEEEEGSTSRCVNVMGISQHVCM